MCSQSATLWWTVKITMMNRQDYFFPHTQLEIIHYEHLWFPTSAYTANFICRDSKRSFWVVKDLFERTFHRSRRVHTLIVKRKREIGVMYQWRDAKLKWKQLHSSKQKDDQKDDMKRDGWREGWREGGDGDYQGLRNEMINSKWKHHHSTIKPCFAEIRFFFALLCILKMYITIVHIHQGTNTLKMREPTKWWIVTYLCL